MDPFGWILFVASIFVAATTGYLFARREPLPAPPPSGDLAALAARVSVLEEERPRFVIEMNGMLDQCDELLGRTRKIRATMHGDRGKEIAVERQEQQLALLSPDDERAAAKRLVAARLNGR
jgi:hypothetical protein